MSTMGQPSNLKKFAFPMRLRERLFVVRLEDGALARVPSRNISGDNSAEFFPCQIGSTTAYQADIFELYRELLAKRAHLIRELRPFGLGIIAASSHPSADWRLQEQPASGQTAAGEARRLFPERRCLVNTLDIDIAIGKAEGAAPVLRYLEFLTFMSVPLTGSSPFWSGMESGYQSVVHTIMGELPGCAFLPVDELVRNLALRPKLLAETMSTRQGVASRPLSLTEAGVASVRFDVPTDPRDILVLLALLTFLAAGQPNSALIGVLTAADNLMVKRENFWRGTKSGMDAIFVHSGRETTHLRPAFADFTDEFSVAPWPAPLSVVPRLLRTIMTRGNSATAQRAAFNARKSQRYPDSSALMDVTMDLIAKTAGACAEAAAACDLGRILE
jgi:carboxylate-amine ligase